MSDPGTNSEKKTLLGSLGSVPDYDGLGASKSPDIEKKTEVPTLVINDNEGEEELENDARVEDSSENDQNLKRECRKYLKRECQKYQRVCLDMLKSPVLVAILAIFFLASVLIPTELVIHILQTIYPLKACNNDSELLQPENTNDVHVQAVQPPEDESDDVVTRIIRVNVLHMLEYLYLFYGFYSFYSKQKIWEKQINFKTITWKFIFCECLKTGMKKLMHCSCKYVYYIPPCLIIFLTYAFGIIAPILGMITAYRFKCKDNRRPEHIVFAYEFVNIFDYLLTVSVRMVFVYFTVSCAAIWSANDIHINSEPNEPSDAAEQSKPEELAIWKTVSKKYYNNIMDYNARTEVVKPIYEIFRYWFIIQWVIYLIYIVNDSANIFRIIRSKTAHATAIQITHIISIIIYDSLVLILSYACALKMNLAMQNYLSKRQKLQMSIHKSCSDCEKLGLTVNHASCAKCKELITCKECKTLQKTCDGCQYMYVYSRKILFIEKNPDSEFNPRIPLIGIDISIATPGFITGVIIALTGAVGLVELPISN